MDNGFTVMLCVVCPPGDQEKVPPGVEGVAVSVAVSPVHIDEELTETNATAFTVTAPVPVLEQPFNE